MAPSPCYALAPAYASLPDDGFSPWPLDPCAKRPRLDMGWSTRQEWGRVTSGDAGQPWTEAAEPCSIALALERACLKQRREWQQRQKLKRRRLDTALPTPLSRPRPLAPGEYFGQLSSSGPSAVDWGDLNGLANAAGHSPSTTGSATAQLNEDVLSSCTALVPYRDPFSSLAATHGASAATATARLWRAKPGVGFEQKAANPKLQLARWGRQSSCSMVGRSWTLKEMAVSLPSFAAQSCPQVVPGRELAIVVYRPSGSEQQDTGEDKMSDVPQGATTVSLD